ncbi:MULTISPECIES: AMP-binding protein [Bacillaceae]|uniref:AMP-binding protein n=1 Tax=Bacillaceae TaxID=186817 RepID=UPI000BFB4C49|nr:MULTISPECIES: AMP-binding protein [Bacillaceae]PGT84127.1 AMP-dependent synthetase [Bacillus sp. AFS040349]UGB33561.1 AMP-binding protein [Metabacillus sp. B2-18]
MNSFKKMEEFGNRTAVYAERKYSYLEMLEIADAICGEIGERTLVFSLCSNNKESLFGYVGFIRGGIVPVLLDASIHIDQLSKLINLYKPTYIWASSENQDLSKLMDRVFVFGNYTLFRCRSFYQHDLHEHLALLLTTSGSTGSPKFVRLSYENIFNNAESISSYLEINADDRPITTLPMNYSYGLSIINSHFICGATIILTDASIMKKEFWDLCREQRVTTFGGVPFVYEMLDRLKFEELHLPSLKKLTQAGGKLSSSLSSKFAKVCNQKGIQFFTMYGQTEATARMSYLPWEKNLEKVGSIGIAIPGGELYLQDDNDNKITTPNVLGELIYKGANVSLGYADSLFDLSKKDENSGILYTGDKAYFDQDGYFFITGRIKRMIKLYGNRISLDEVEGFLNENGHDCICDGTDDQMNIYTLKDDSVQIKKIIKEKLNLKGFKIMKIKEIPRNHFGKILYSELRKYG